MINAIKDADVYGRVFVKAHSGAICLAVNRGRETWMEINPASPEWFNAPPYGYDFKVRSAPLSPSWACL